VEGARCILVYVCDNIIWNNISIDIFEDKSYKNSINNNYKRQELQELKYISRVMIMIVNVEVYM
jgi:hypothetical protein